MSVKQKSVKINFLMNIILNMSSLIFPIITFPYVSRILLPVGTGKVSFVTSVVSYFAMLANLGIPTYGIRACAKVRDNKEELSRIVHELFIINIITSTISYLLLFGTVMLIPTLRQEKLLFVVVSSTIILNTMGMEWLYKSLEQYAYITVRSIVFKFVALILMFAFVHTERDYVIYGGISVFASVASNIFNFINVHRHISIRPVGNYNLRRHLKAVAVFFAMSCATTIYTNLDTVMLGFMKGSEEVGYYNAAVKIKGVLLSIVTSLGAVLLPRCSYFVEKGMIDEFKRISSKAINFVFLFATPVMVYFILFAKQGIYFLSGSAYADAIIPMKIIMPTILLIGLTNILGIQILVPLGKEKFVLYSEIAGAVVDLLFNVFFIPVHGASGAAMGTLIAEGVVLLVQYMVLRKEICGTFQKICYFRFILATVLGGIASIWILTFRLGSFITLLISAICFFGMYVVTLIVLKEPLVLEIKEKIFHMIKNIFKSVNNKR